MALIKLKRGTRAELDAIVLAIGELGYCTDTKELFIGNGVSNTLFNTASSISILDSADYFVSSNVEGALGELGELNTANGFDLQTPDLNGEISFNNTTREVTIAPKAGQTEYRFWVAGKKVINTSSVTVQIPDVTGTYYVYFDSAGVLQSTDADGLSMDVFYMYAIVALVYWNATSGDYIFGDERHGIRMDSRDHNYNHSTFGTRYAGGLDITGLTAGVNTYSQSNSGTMWDEDIEIKIALQTTHPFIYRAGTDGAWNIITPNNALGHIASGGTYISYNEYTGTTWQLTACANNDYSIVYFIATNDIRYPVMKVVGQKTYKNLNIAQDSVPKDARNINLAGLPTKEYIFLYAILVDSAGAVQTLSTGDLLIDLRSTNIYVTGGSASQHLASDVPTDTTNFNGILSATETDVQSALEILDDHAHPLGTFSGHLIPALPDTYDVGTLENPWRDLYLGPQSLYVNGQQVISDDAGTIRFHADPDQNLSIQTSGTGDVELVPSGTGNIELKGTVQVNAGKHIRSSDGSNIEIEQNVNIAGNLAYHAGNLTITTLSGIPYSEKGTADGVAELDATGKVPSAQLPSFVDDALEYAALANFPATGESGKVYIAIDTNITYRWSGTVYVPIGSDLALGETSTTAYRGDRGKIAYDHSQVTGNPHGVQENVQADWNATTGLSAILNTPSTFTPSSHSHNSHSDIGANDHHNQAHGLGSADHSTATLAQLNAKISDATLIDTGDSRLSDARPASDVYAWAKATSKPSYTYSEVGAEQAFTKNTAFNKNFGSAAGTVTQGNDSRLSDARTPVAHTHTEANITDLDKYTQAEVDNKSDITVRDARDDGDITPANSLDHKVSFTFTDDITGSTHIWDSVITVKGWSSTYNAWQLIGDASQGSPDENLYLRFGSDTLWGSLHKIWHSGNFDPSAKSDDTHNHDLSYLSLTGGTLTGPLSFTNNTITPESVTFEDTTQVGMRVTNVNGYFSITPLNTNWLHLYTDRSRVIFNTPIHTTANIFSSYNNDLLLQRAGTTKLTLGDTVVTSAVSLAAPEFSENGVSLNLKYLGINAKAADSDRLDGVDLSQINRFHSESDFIDGTLVKTDIPANVTNGASFVIEISGKSYDAVNPPFKVIAQGYLYSDIITKTSGISYGGEFATQLKMFEYEGYLQFWWPRISYWNSFSIHVRDAIGSSNNRVVSIINSVDPVGTKEVYVTLKRSWNSYNDGADSGLDADKLDSLESTQFLRSDASGTLDAGENTSLTILCDDTGESVLNLYGPSQGTGRLFVGQSTQYGGGIEYNGDGSPTSMDEANTDYIVWYRKTLGVNYWTAKNAHNSNDWIFRGNITAASFIGKATDSDKLDNLDSSQFLRSDVDATSSHIIKAQDFRLTTPFYGSIDHFNNGETKLSLNMLGQFSDSFQFATIHGIEHDLGAGYVAQDVTDDHHKVFAGFPTTGHFIVDATVQKFRIIFQTKSAHPLGGLLQIYQEWTTGGPKPYIVEALERSATNDFSAPTTLLSGWSVGASYFAHNSITDHSGERYYRITFDVSGRTDPFNLAWIRSFTTRLSYGQFGGLPFTWDAIDVDFNTLGLTTTGDIAAAGLTLSGAATLNASVTVNNTLTANLFNSPGATSYDKLRVWNDSQYTIGMMSAMTYGDLNDYAMTFTFSNIAERGFIWRHTSHTKDQGAMSLTTDGRLTVDQHIRIGAIGHAVKAFTTDVTLGGETPSDDNVPTEAAVKSYVDVAITDVASGDHNHDLTYLGLTAKAADSDKLDGFDSTQFLRSDTNNSYYRTAGITTFRNTPGDIADGTGSKGSLHVYQPDVGADAFMMFHIGGQQAQYFGLESATNDFFVGGWSKGASKYRIWHKGNTPSPISIGVRHDYTGTGGGGIQGIGEGIHLAAYTPNIVLEDLSAGAAHFAFHNNNLLTIGRTDLTATNLTSDITIDASGNVKIQGYLLNTEKVKDTIVVRTDDGSIRVQYVYSSHIYMDHAIATRSSDTIFYSSTDNFIRKTNASGMRSALDLSTYYALRGGSYTYDFAANFLNADQRVDAYVALESFQNVYSGLSSRWGSLGGEGGNMFSNAGNWAGKIAHYPRTVADTDAVYISQTGGDNKIRFRADGHCYNDGAWQTTNADYAEYFEWEDGNLKDEDRVGHSVILVGDKIRLATMEDPPSSILGVVSGSPGVVGDSGELKWNKKHKKDKFNRDIQGPVNMVGFDAIITAKDDSGETKEERFHVREDQIPTDIEIISDIVVEKVRYEAQISDEYDDTLEYVPRSERKEWDTIGFMGKLRLLKGQPVGDRWLKMRDIDETVEEWLVR